MSRDITSVYVSAEKYELFDMLVLIPQGDIWLKLVERIDDKKMFLTLADGKSHLHNLYMFRWWVNETGKIDGLNFEVQGFYALNFRDALKMFYRYIRLIALGESREVAAEVANGELYEFLSPNLEEAHMYKFPIPFASNAFEFGKGWQSPDGMFFETRGGCEMWMKATRD